MSKEKLEQSAAFPTSESYSGQEGISKRLWVATQLLAADISAENHPYETTQETVEYAYIIADEVLRQENL